LKSETPVHIPLKGEKPMPKPLFLVVLLAFPAVLWAQETPKVELFGGYSFANASFISRVNVNGWNLSGTVNLNRWFGVTTDFGGLYGISTTTILSSVTTSFDGHVHTFLAGPQFSFRREKVTPFGHFLLGGARLAGTATLSFLIPLPPIPIIPGPVSVSNSAFSLAVGGGVDYEICQRFAWRVQTDYLQTGFSGGRQDNFRLSTGIVFRFGE
jgi:opacity protein-like surface antigen